MFLQVAQSVTDAVPDSSVGVVSLSTKIRGQSVSTLLPRYIQLETQK